MTATKDAFSLMILAKIACLNVRRAASELKIVIYALIAYARPVVTSRAAFNVNSAQPM